MQHSTRDRWPQRKRPTILVVEDEIGMLATCRDILRHTGYHVLSVASGEQALRAFEMTHGDIDVVILDWQLPDMPGDKRLDCILEIDPKAKVIFFTGHVLSDDLRAELEPKVKGFLYKPFTADEMIEAVEAALGEQQACDTASSHPAIQDDGEAAGEPEPQRRWWVFWRHAKE